VVLIHIENFVAIIIAVPRAKRPPTPNCLRWGGWGDTKIGKMDISCSTYFPKYLSEVVSPGRHPSHKIENDREEDAELFEGWRLGRVTKIGKRYRSRGTYFSKCISKAVSAGRVYPMRSKMTRRRIPNFLRWRLGCGTKIGKRHISRRTYFPKYISKVFSPGRHLISHKIEDNREEDTEFSKGWSLGWDTKIGKRYNMLHGA
jgi:hypothetical protein